MNYRNFVSILALCAAFSTGMAQKLDRGEGLYFTENSDTYGAGNIWVNGHGRAFYWDNPNVETGFPLKIFPCLGIDAGILPFMDAGISAELLSYGFAVPGNVKVRTKFTLPTNTKLRLWGAALSLAYKKNFLETPPSIGFRNQGVAFYAEGLMYLGNSLEIKLIGDADLIACKSFLPLKAFLNIGSAMPLDRDYAFFDQYTFSAGLAYKGLNTDFFVEYSMEILNSFTSPLKVEFTDWTSTKVFEHYFSENPLYVTPGVRIRYDNGLTLFAAAPLTVSKEVAPPAGSLNSVTRKPGYTDGFSPFYTNWKLAGKMSFPIRFVMPGSEMMRKFMLMKNKKEKQTMDIDEEINRKPGPEGPQPSENEQRMQDLQKEKENITKDGSLE